MTGLRPPASLDLHNIGASMLRTWFEAFEDYYSLSYSKPDDEQKRMLFLTVAGRRVRELVKGFDPPPATYDELKNNVINHCQPVKSACVERNVIRLV